METAPIKKPEPELQDLIGRYQSLYGGVVSDVLDEMGYRDQVLPHEISGLRPGMRFAGVALPLYGEPASYQDKDKLLIPWMKMLQDVTPGAVIVSQPNDSENAHFGELSSHAAKIHGCQGVVIDGGCRDIDYILNQSKLPVFCRYTTPRDIKGRWLLRGHNVAIQIGRATIEPGDFIVADIDAVVVVPSEITAEVLEKAEEVANTENLTRKMILEGKPPLEAYLKHRRF